MLELGGFTGVQETRYKALRAFASRLLLSGIGHALVGSVGIRVKWGEEGSRSIAIVSNIPPR